jgi:hypothetical protein
MPGFMLHGGASVLCIHGGQAHPSTFSPRVTVSGQPIVTQPHPYVISGCPLPPVANGPCLTAQWITAATRVTSMGAPVLLLNSQAICAPSGTPLRIVATQTRTTAT